MRYGLWVLLALPFVTLPAAGQDTTHRAQWEFTAGLIVPVGYSAATLEDALKVNGWGATIPAECGWFGCSESKATPWKESGGASGFLGVGYLVAPSTRIRLEASWGDLAHVLGSSGAAYDLADVQVSASVQSLLIEVGDSWRLSAGPALFTASVTRPFPSGPSLADLQATATTKTLIGLVVGVSGVSSEGGTGFARWFAQYRWTGSVQIQGRFVDPHGGGFLTLPPTDVPVSHFVLGVALGIRP